MHRISNSKRLIQGEVEAMAKLYIDVKPPKVSLLEKFMEKTDLSSILSKMVIFQ